MKKITSFLAMVVLCCFSAVAQDVVGSDLPKDMLIKIGTAQTEVVAGQWYFLHNPRNPNNAAEAFDQDGLIQSAGGLVTENGEGEGVKLSATTVIDELTTEEGVNAKDFYKHMVRFVAVEGMENVYYIQFGTGNWLKEMTGGNSTVLTTVSNNAYHAGLAGKYNFYLIKNESDEQPNTAGRFGWNKFDMANRIDNNGAGGTVVFWENGESVGSDLGGDNEAIKGNRVWQIYDIQIVGDLDKWNEAFQALLNAYITIDSYYDGDEKRVDNWAAGVGVGTEPGNYKKEYIDAFLAIHNQIDAIMTLSETEGNDVVKEQYTAEELDALATKYGEAYTAAVQNKVPRAMTTIEPGYYFIQSMLNWYETVQDTTFYTEEEANEANAESGAVEGEEGFVSAGDVKEVTSRQADAPIKALKSHDSGGEGWVAWMNLEKSAEWLWKIERDETDSTGTKYYLINAYRNNYFNGITQSNNSKLSFEPATACFDYRTVGVAPVSGDSVTVINIRGSQHPENNYNYIHCGGHSSGAGKSGWAVGWSDGGATQWTLLPVSADEVEQILNGPEAQVKKMVAKGDSIANAFPAQLKIAQDMLTIVHEDDSVVVNASQFYSQYTTNDAQSIPEGQTVYDFMLDGKQSTYWHSAWEAGAVSAKVHYLQVEATDVLDGNYAVKLQRRPVSGDHITQLIVKGYVEAPTDETTFDEGTTLATLDLPLSANNETIISEAFDATGMMYLRFYSTTTAAASSGGGANRGYWHASAFNVFKADVNKRYETVQYDARKAEADALIAAVDAWVAGEFSADSVELYTDEAFNAKYNALLAAYGAWDAVYVNPSELRSVIAAAPANDLFVVGTNPGEWSADAETPAAAVAAAQAYDESGAYDAETSAAHIAAIEKVVDEVYANANPVKENVWYRIKFASEDMFDQYGWDKVAGAAVVSHDITTSTGLFGKTVAAGNSIKAYESYETEDGSAGEVTVFDVEEAEEFFEGQKLMFFEDELGTDAELFRFIAVSDSTFMIQNKATGLYIRATHPAVLSATPSVFQQSAIGAGGNVLRAYNVNGGEDSGYNYLHGQVDDMALVTWDVSSLGSRSMFLIEEVEAVSDVPSNNYVQKLWPGQLNAYALPVDVTVGEGATAYGAQLNVTEEDTTVVLMAIEAEVIKGGTPFILVADSEEEYVTYADRLAEIKANLKEDLGDDYTSNDDLAAEAIVKSEFYAQVEMTHGETLAHEVDTLGSLVGAFENTTVSAGKGIQTKENGFTHMIVNSNMAAYRAWIKCDFDAESDDVLKGIEIKIEGSIDTGINEALSNVVKGGDIYTVGGQLVGKGNINKVNSLPAGIYVVNGVKVIKK